MKNNDNFQSPGNMEKLDIKKTAILIFGTFNPVTLAHIELGRRANNFLPEADIIYIPSNLGFMKDWKSVDETFLTDDERLMLLKDAASEIGAKEAVHKESEDESISAEEKRNGEASSEKCQISDAEITGVCDGRTYNSVQFLKKSGGYDCIYIVMGTDKLGEISRWYRADELFSENKILVFERSGECLDDCMNDFIMQRREQFISMQMEDEYEEISSTAVRNAFLEKNPESVKKYLPESVYEFLCEKYRGKL